jgi:hypothetical protein
VEKPRHCGANPSRRATGREGNWRTSRKPCRRKASQMHLLVLSGKESCNQTRDHESDPSGAPPDEDLHFPRHV